MRSVDQGGQLSRPRRRQAVPLHRDDLEEDPPHEATSKKKIKMYKDLDFIKDSNDPWGCGIPDPSICDTLLLQKHHLALKMALLITLLQRDYFPVLAEQDTWLHALPVSHHITTDKPPAGPALQVQARTAPPECATEFSYII